MKLTWLITILVISYVLFFGAPFAKEKPMREHYYNSPELILPMTFAHMDHTTVGCVECHHNYVDDTGNEPCMICHVTDQKVWPLFEEQFHTLCQGCHEDLAADNQAGGPVRRCLACHLAEDLP